MYTSWMRSLIARHATHILAASEAAAEAFWGADWKNDSRQQILYYGLPAERFARSVNREQIRRELNLPENAKMVLNVGRVNWHKRQRLLVEVAREVLKARDDIYFVLVGDGPQRAIVETSVREAGLSDRFRFLSAGPPEVDQYFLAADIFAFPSVSEGFGVVVIEAAAAGLDLIACDIPGVREAATASSRKILLPLEAGAGEWSRAILDALSHPRLPEPERIAGLRDFPFDIAKSVQKLMQVYGP